MDRKSTPRGASSSSSSPSPPPPPSPPKLRRLRVRAWSTYSKLRVVGAGAFGQVYLARRAAPGTPTSEPTLPTDGDYGGGGGGVFVLKRIFLHGSDESVQSAAVEVKVYEGLPPHPNIVAFHEHFLDDEGYLNIVLECCPFADLEKLIAMRREAQRPFSLKETLFLAFQLLAGLRHLHRHGLLYRDCKPSNLVLTSFDPHERAAAIAALAVASSSRSNAQPTPMQASGAAGDESDGEEALPIGIDVPPQLLRDCSHCCLKITDLGIAKVLQDTHAQATTVIGTPNYISPEICESAPYTASADIWAAGAVIYEIASTGEKLFGGGSMLAIVKAICRGEVPNVPGRPEMDAVVLPLVREMVTLDPSKRITADDAITKYFSPAPGDSDFAEDFEDPDEFNL